MSEDPLLLEAQSAISSHDNKKARDILRRLIKADPRNIDYWLWLSVSVDTPREIIYCLQEARKIDPGNTIVKKGLIFYGIIKPDPTIREDLLSKKREWKQEVIRNFTPPKPEKRPVKVRQPFSPVVWISLVIALVISASLITGFPWRLFKPQAATITISRPTSKPSATYLPTKTPIGYVAPPTAIVVEAIPLSLLLEATYTPTPVYINTPHPSEAYSLAIRAYNSGDLDAFRGYINQVISVEKGSADLYYFLAEADLKQGRNDFAKENYEKALSINPKFAPAYLGRARMTILLSGKKDYYNDINKAIEYDSGYVDAYLERAKYYVRTHRLPEAKTDLEMVLRLNPEVPEAYTLFSEIHLSNHDPVEALIAAQTANQMDVTFLRSYLTLGAAYIAAGRLQDSIEPLQIFNDYTVLDARAYEILGLAYWTAGDVNQALAMMTRSIELDKTSFTPYYIRGMANLKLDNRKIALDDLSEAVKINDNSFVGVYNRAKALLYLGRNTEAYNQFLRSEDLSDDEELLAEIIYQQAKAALAIGDKIKINKAWKRLLELPEDTVPKAYADEARSYIFPCKGSKCPTFTPSPTICSTSGCPTVTEATPTP